MDEYTSVRIVDQKIDNPQALGMGRSVIVFGLQTSTHHGTAVLGLGIPIIALPLWVFADAKSVPSVCAVSWTGR